MSDTTIIFLDIDGVVVHGRYNPNNRSRITAIDPGCCRVIDQLAKAVNGEIVISSTWRLLDDLHILRCNLRGSGLKTPVIDITPILETGLEDRGLEIKDWLSKHSQYKKFIIIDDDIYDIEQYFEDRSCIIHVRDGWNNGGIQEKHIERFLKDKKKMKKKELEKLIKEASDAYYNRLPIVSDTQFDSMLDELRDIDPDNELLKTVGSAPPEDSRLRKVKHVIPMGSQNNAFNVDDFRKWAEKTKAREFCITEKLDGISVEAVYNNGVLVVASTRGDGVTGEDITHSAVHCNNIPEQLDAPFTGSLRGEALLPISYFKEHMADTYANPRNTVSGILRRKTPDIDVLNNVRIVWFDVLASESLSTEVSKYDYISDELGLVAVPHKVANLEDTIKIYEQFEEKRRKHLDYEIDGLVIKVNSLAIQDALGIVNNRPKGQIALKFAAKLEEATVEKITWEVGKTGRVTPVAHITPTEVGGVTIRRASLYNLAYINKLGVGPGAKVKVSRAGDVIPRIETVVEPGNTITVPENCPRCETVLVKSGEYIQCPSLSCPARQLGNLEKWVEVTGIEECGPAFLKDVLDKGYVDNVDDLYTLTVDDLLTFPGYRKKKATKIIENINKKKEFSLPVFLAALNIANVSTSKFAKVVDAGFDTYDKIKKATTEDLLDIPGIGEITAELIVKGLSENEWIIENLFHNGIKIEEAGMGKLSGMSFCFTGALDIKRSDAEKLVKHMGGTTKKSVTKDLTYLVQADPSSTSGKTQKAQKYGTQVIGEDEFMELVDFDIKKLI